MSFYKISVILQLCYLILISDTALFQNTAQKTEVGLYMLYYLQIENFCSGIKCRRSTKYQMLQKKYRALWRKPWLMRRHPGSLNSDRHRKAHFLRLPEVKLYQVLNSLLPKHQYGKVPHNLAGRGWVNMVN